MIDVLSCSFSPNSTLLATTSADQTIKLWDTSSWTCDKTLMGHQQWVWDAAWSADSAFLLTGASDKSARLWGSPVFIFPAPFLPFS
jgi:target of rapamycin complex subunit LST8